MPTKSLIFSHRSVFMRTALLGTLATGSVGSVGCAGDGSEDGSGEDTSDDGSTDGGADGTDTGADGTGTGGTDGTEQCPVPAEWSAPDWDANTSDAMALRTQLATLVGDETMRGAENGDVAVDELSDLTTPYEAGSPSLSEVTHAGYAPIVTDSFEEFVSVLDAGARDLVDEDGNWDPGVDGGLYGSDNRGINEGGLELRQLVDKGLFSGGAMYAYALELTEGEIDAATIDAIAAVWGTNAMLDAEADLADAAGYSFDMGFHGTMADALIAAKAHAANPDCTAERDEALVSFFNAWEQSMFARMVYYTNQMALILATAASDDDYAQALHEHAEGLGLAAGFYKLPDPGSGPLGGGGRIITDAQIETIMTAFGVDLTDLGASTTGTFVESLPDFETAQETAEGTVIEVYDVTAEDIASYREPTPG